MKRILGVVVVILLLVNHLSAGVVAQEVSQDIRTRYMGRSGDMESRGIGYHDAVVFERYLEWETDTPVEIVGMSTMIDVDPVIGYMNEVVCTHGRIEQEIGGGRTAMTVEVSTSPQMRQDGALLIDRVSVVVINDINKQGELFSMIYGVNTNTETVMFPKGHSVHLNGGDSLYVHMDVCNGAMGKGYLMPTTKVIIYYFDS